MSKVTNEVNPYLILGKLYEKGVDYDKIKEFIVQFAQIGMKKGEDGIDLLNHFKNFSMELNDAIMTSCVLVQSELPTQVDENYDIRRATVSDAAKIYGVSAATIRNWINDENNPLESQNVGERQTTVLLKDLFKYATAKGFKKLTE